MDTKEAKDILSDMRDQHLCFLGDLEIKDEWQKKISRKHGRVIPEQKHWKSRFHANLKNMFQIFRTIYFPLKNVRNAEHLLLVKK